MKKIDHFLVLINVFQQGNKDSIKENEGRTIA